MNKVWTRYVTGSLWGLFSRRTKMVDLDKSVLKRNGNSRKPT
jgi:hypothetical protein